MLLGSLQGTYTDPMPRSIPSASADTGSPPRCAPAGCRSAPRQIGDRPRQLEHAVIRPRAQVHLPHRRAEELAAGLVHRAVVAHLGRAHVGVGGQARGRGEFQLGAVRAFGRPAPRHGPPGTHVAANARRLLHSSWQPANYTPRRNREHLRNPGHPWLKTHRTLSWRSTSRICTSDVTQGSCGVR